MKWRLFVYVLPAVLIMAGCAHHRAEAPITPVPSAPVTANPPPIVTPDNSLSAKVVRYNAIGRFVVLSFPVGQMPKTGQTFFLYQGGMKAGEIKITGPQRDNDTVADVTEGTAQVGDDVREQ